MSRANAGMRVWRGANEPARRMRAAQSGTVWLTPRDAARSRNRLGHDRQNPVGWFEPVVLLEFVPLLVVEPVAPSDALVEGRNEPHEDARKELMSGF